MKRVYLGILMVVFASCQYFETEKVTSEAFLEEEIATINWNDVDQYPSFPLCQQYSDKEEQISCFQQVIVQSINAQLTNEDQRSTQNLMDTLHLYLSIDREGNIEIKEMKMDSLLQNDLPHVWRKLELGIRDLPDSSPAYKRGIPVATEIVLPVILRTRDL